MIEASWLERQPGFVQCTKYASGDHPLLYGGVIGIQL
jgi:hypothetical protein